MWGALDQSLQASKQKSVSFHTDAPETAEESDGWECFSMWNALQTKIANQSPGCEESEIFNDVCKRRHFTSEGGRARPLLPATTGEEWSKKRNDLEPREQVRTESDVDDPCESVDLASKWEAINMASQELGQIKKNSHTCVL